MAILDTELLMLKSEGIDDTTPANNGGRMDNNASVTPGAANNVFPSVFKAERISGSVKYRKTFCKVANDDDDTLFNPQFWLDNTTPADDWVTIFAGTQTDNQSNITGNEDHYGCAVLQSDVSAGAGSIVVTVEDSSLVTGGADEIFRDGDTIRITNKDTPESAVGTEEIHSISGTPTVSGNDVTITLADNLANPYNVSDNTYGTRVMSVLESADIVSSIGTVTTSGKTFDDTVVTADNIGSIEQVITLTFTDSSNFTASSDVPGVSLSGGSISSLYEPNNPDVSKPYLSIPTSAWTDTYTNGDTVTIPTHPAAFAIWQKRTVPAGASSLSGNKAVVVFTGEAV